LLAVGEDDLPDDLEPSWRGPCGELLSERPAALPQRARHEALPGSIEAESNTAGSGATEVPFVTSLDAGNGPLSEHVATCEVLATIVEALGQDATGAPLRFDRKEYRDDAGRTHVGYGLELPGDPASFVAASTHLQRPVFAPGDFRASPLSTSYRLAESVWQIGPGAVLGDRGITGFNAVVVRTRPTTSGTDNLR
jgi:hypothetical protein